MFCYNCGKQVDEKAQICVSCGLPCLPKDVATEMSVRHAQGASPLAGTPTAPKQMFNVYVSTAMALGCTFMAMACLASLLLAITNGGILTGTNAFFAMLFIVAPPISCCAACCLYVFGRKDVDSPIAMIVSVMGMVFGSVNLIYYLFFI